MPGSLERNSVMKSLVVVALLLSSTFAYAGEQAGKVSYYRGRHHPTHQYTAAHRSLPFGTKVRIVRGNLVCDDVVINDRGPFIRGRIIDVNTACARKLALQGPGVAPVKIYW